MTRLLQAMLGFTGKRYSTTYKLLAMGPGVLVFLIISPLVIFFISRQISAFFVFSCPRSLELSLVVITGLMGIGLMNWALYALWFIGEGTPAPIAPTQHLVTQGPYRLCRNPVELGTDLHFFVIGAYFDSLLTGLLCFLFSWLLGTSYIKLIEEKELRLRFGAEYEAYLQTTPFMSLWYRKQERS